MQKLQSLMRRLSPQNSLHTSLHQNLSYVINGLIISVSFSGVSVTHSQEHPICYNQRDVQLSQVDYLPPSPEQGR